MFIWKQLIQFLGHRKIIWVLFIINALGTIYGYIWYKQQLVSTQWWLLIFVPDSPTASLFFTIFLLMMLLYKKWEMMEAFAAVTLVKYGIWASVMIFWTGLLGGELNWQHYMLLSSHLGMAIQALLYTPYFTFKWYHLLIVGIWTVTNDIMDYSLAIFPSLNDRLHPHLMTIYGFTLCLSVSCLTLFYLLVVRRWIKSA